MTADEAMTLEVGDIVRFLDNGGEYFGFPQGSESAVSKPSTTHPYEEVVRVWTYFPQIERDLWTEAKDCELVRRKDGTGDFYAQLLTTLST